MIREVNGCSQTSFGFFGMHLDLVWYSKTVDQRDLGAPRRPSFWSIFVQEKVLSLDAMVARRVEYRVYDPSRCAARNVDAQLFQLLKVCILKDNWVFFLCPNTPKYGI